MCRRSFAVVEIRSDCSTLIVVMGIKSVCATLFVVMEIKSVCSTLIVVMGIKSVCATLICFKWENRLFRSKACQSSVGSKPIFEQKHAYRGIY